MPVAPMPVAAMPVAPAAPAATGSAPKQSAVIGPSMSIKGEIRAREELLVEGEVEGMLESQSLLTVGPNGKVRGNIKARHVAIFGSVRGNVEVMEKIGIREQGSLIGDIKAAGILTKNPMYVLVHGYRSIFLENQAPDFGAVWKLWLVATVVCLLGHAWFYKLRKSFADLL